MSDLGDLTVNEDGSRAISDGTIVGRPYMDQNPDDLKNNVELAKFTSQGELSKAYIDLHGNTADVERKLQNSIQPLGENPTDEQKTAHQASINKFLGVPDSAEGYTGLVKPEGLPDGMPYDDGLHDLYRATVKELNLTPTQAKGIFDKMNARSAENWTAFSKQKADDAAAEEAALKTEWGANYAENLEKNRRGYRMMGGEELDNFMKDSGLANNAMICKAFKTLFDKVGDDVFEGVHDTKPKNEIERTASGMPVFSYDKSKP